MKNILATVAALVACAWNADGATLHVDDFNGGVLSGWTGGAAPTHVSDGGPNGAGDGFLRISSFGSNLATFNVEPAWTGNFSAIDAGQVEVDLMSPADSAPLEIRFVLFAATQFSATGERWTSTTAHLVPNDGLWRRYTFSLAHDALSHVAGQAPYATMFSDVTRVMLRHDPGTPDATGTAVVGTLNIDNVQLATAEILEVPGDFDGDGDVDGADLAAPVVGWAARFGADLTGEHFLLWQRQLGAEASNSFGQPVPEPDAVLAAAILAATAAARFARRSK